VKRGEHSARTLKATILANFLQQYGFSLDLARQLDPNGWRTVANCARIAEPSQDKTVPMILEILRRREQERFRAQLMDLELKTRPKQRRRRAA
jgi:hypothetical protein